MAYIELDGTTEQVTLLETFIIQTMLGVKQFTKPEPQESDLTTQLENEFRKIHEQRVKKGITLW